MAQRREILLTDVEPTDTNVLWLHRVDGILVLQLYSSGGWETIGGGNTPKPDPNDITIFDLVIKDYPDNRVPVGQPIKFSYTLSSGNPNEYQMWIDNNNPIPWRPIEEFNALTVYSTLGEHTIYVKMRDTINKKESNTISVTYTGTEISTDDILCFVNYSTLGSIKDSIYEDQLYGGYINYNLMNYQSSLDNWTIVSKSGKQNPSIKFMTEEEKLQYSGLSAINTWTGGRNMSTDLSGVFSIGSSNNIEYFYSYSYSSSRDSLWGLKLPNGNYKIRLLSSSTEANDKYDNATISINKQEVTIPGGDIPYTNNTEWTDYIPCTVTDGKLVIWFHLEPKLRTGINAIEVVKIV